jgi:type II secretory pathway pseudopilin PulG
MPSKGFTILELVMLALLIGIIALIALPNFTDSLPNFTASKEKAFVASMKADLMRLALAEEDYYRDSLRYSTVLACTTPATPGTVRYCVSPHNTIGGPVIAGPGWAATITNDHLPGVVCAIFVHMANATPPATREGTPACK